MMRAISPSIVRERRLKLAFFLGALALIFCVLVFVQNMLVSFLLAFVTFYLLAPAVDFFERRGFSRLVATCIPFGVLTLALVISGVLFFPLLLEQAKSLQADAPKYIESMNQLLAKLEGILREISSTVGASDLSASLQPKLAGWISESAHKLPDLITQSLTVVFMVPFLAFYMLLDGRDFMRQLFNLVPNSLFEMVLDLNHQISTQMGGFIRARLLESIVVGLIVWIGLMIMGFPFALLLGVFAGILNVIPYLGPAIGALPAVLIALSNGASVTDYILLAAVFGISQFVDAVILVPFLVAKIVNLHPVTVILAVIVGSQLMGIVGMIICIPLVSTLKVTSIAIYRHLTHFRD